MGWQPPTASQVLWPEQALGPEPQALPNAAVKNEVERAGSHTKQGLPLASAPAGRQTSSIKQPAQVLTQELDTTSQMELEPHSLTFAEQASAASSQVEMPLHATPSSHTRWSPAHAPSLHASLTVQNNPSSQAASLGDQLPASRSGSQIKQALLG